MIAKISWPLSSCVTPFVGTSTMSGGGADPSLWRHWWTNRDNTGLVPRVGTATNGVSVRTSGACGYDERRLCSDWYGYPDHLYQGFDENARVRAIAGERGNPIGTRYGHVLEDVGRPLRGLWWPQPRAQRFVGQQPQWSGHAYGPWPRWQRPALYSEIHPFSLYHNKDQHALPGYVEPVPRRYNM